MSLALVTGVSSGIGSAVARRLTGLGWQVVGLARTPGPFTTHPVDLLDGAALRSTLDTVDGPVDAVVHAAGVQRTARLGRLDPADGELMWRLHVEVASLVVNALADRLADGGRIVLLGSRTMTGAAGKSQYAATKAALVGLARSWAMELLPRGITVNVVAPGPTDTPMLRDPGRSATPPNVPPLGRLVRPDEVAGMVAFLLGPDGGMVTGQHLVMCAGASLA